MATPAPVARLGTDILFLDMLDVGRSPTTAIGPTRVLEEPWSRTSAARPWKFLIATPRAIVCSVSFHFFWDEKGTICPVWMDTEYRCIADELGYGNITAHESKETDEFRWLHSGGDRASAIESERICMPLFTSPCTNSPFLSETRKLRSEAFVEIHTDTEHLGLERPTQAIFRPSPFDSAEEFFSINLVAAERSEAALGVLGQMGLLSFPIPTKQGF